MAPSVVCAEPGCDERVHPRCYQAHVQPQEPAPGAGAPPQVAEAYCSVHAQPTAVQLCAAAEAAAQRRDVPIFGLSGGQFALPQRPRPGGHSASDLPAGSAVEPGPLFWRQEGSSYTAALVASGGAAALHTAMVGAGARASPGSGVTYRKCGGTHATGAGGLGFPGTPEKLSKLNFRFVCSQSGDAARLHEGAKKTAAKLAKRERGSGAAGPYRRGTVSSHDCAARFSVAIRNEKSRKKMCTICNAMVVFKHDAEPDPVPFPTAMVDGVCPWASVHGGNEHCVRSGFRVGHVATVHTGHFARTTRLGQRVDSGTASLMAAARTGWQASNATVAAAFAEKTGGMLSTGEVNRLVRRADADGGKDTGFGGLLAEFRQQRPDVACVPPPKQQKQ